MTERESVAAQFHAIEVAPRKLSHVDMAGGENEVIETKPGTDEATLQVRKSVDQASSDEDEDEDYEGKPTAEEKQTLRRVSGRIPWRAFLVAIVELAERFTYYGLSGPFQNYIQNPYPGINDDGQRVPGAINLGQEAATGLTNFFQFWCYLTPILGAIIADQYLGRYHTILWSAVVYMIGNIILFLTSLPIAIEHNAALGGLIVSMIVIGLGTGGIKSNVSPLIAEQFQETRLKVKTLKSGERVIVDPALTVQAIYMFFYMCINIGSLSSIATTELEQRVGFWAAYLLPLCMFAVAIIVLVLGKNIYIQRPPESSVIKNAFHAFWIGARNRNLDAARPSYQNAHGNRYRTPWNDLFVDELRRALVACKVLAFYPIYWIVYSQMLNNFVSQAGQMQLHGIPNDLMGNIDPIAIIIFIPILDRLVYPGLRRIGIPFRPITRVFWGFMFAAISMAFAAMCQKLIYARNGNVNVGLQTPGYFFIAISEIFTLITGLEYAYTKAPASMKSLIMSMYLFAGAVGSALAEALTPLDVNPKLTWMYGGLGIFTFVAGWVFWAVYHRYNATEELMNELEGKIRKAGQVTTERATAQDVENVTATETATTATAPNDTMAVTNMDASIITTRVVNGGEKL